MSDNGLVGPPGPPGLGLNGTCRCSACLRPIVDRWMLGVGEALFHERCLLCQVCRLPLHRSCYARQGAFYCRNDYDRLFGRKCLGCGDQVPAEELVMRVGSSGPGYSALPPGADYSTRPDYTGPPHHEARPDYTRHEAVFHMRCFVCVVCGGRLQKGDQFVVKQGQLFCRADYEKEVEMLQAFAQGELQCGGDDGVGGRGGPGGGDGRRGPKRPRTILTTQQRRAFKASFELSPKPCRKVREGLAKDTGLSVRIVQVWFQNQRAKMKKIQKKQRLDPKNSGKDSDGADDIKSEKPKMKEEEASPCSGAGGFVNDSCSDTEGGHGLEGSLHGEANFKGHDDHFYKDMIDAEQPRQFLHSG
ncbi:LIM homeobox transcription factor 1-beta [Nilaparvata lugens]|uniref:LIM homeobox transcription factor 1-beta n=1 Tax=Nilaparvata lugens TaxID=108931 RepID=UPI00193E193B|nr:LIM homeobox transcription factor 1-beta [Nilaparvata lugens]XP_039285923.1 LIM homeobox transcription factor 1-beta [Nilaparvata lugens]XP_039285924.1 LIM homeobox transcription factor 1-beta [Nilaparvata lugens]